MQKYNNEWLFKNELFKETYTDIVDKNLYGFIYLITDTKEQVYYIGEKSFHSFRTPKGKTNKKRIESNWAKYPSSNGLLSLRIKSYDGNHNNRFTYNILALCTDKSIMKYVETKWIMAGGAIISDKYLNDNVKINVLTTYKRYAERVPKELSYNDFLDLTQIKDY